MSRPGFREGDRACHLSGLGDVDPHNVVGCPLGPRPVAAGPGINPAIRTKERGTFLWRPSGGFDITAATAAWKQQIKIGQLAKGGFVDVRAIGLS